MKKEMLRISDFNFEYNPTRKLSDISLCMMEGECTGFLGLTQSGKDLLVHILSGDIPANLQNVYIEGKCIVNVQGLKSAVYRIVGSNYRIGDWNIAEYIGLVASEPLRGFLKGRSITAAMQEFMDSLDFPLDAAKRLKDLTELEKRLADLAKACYTGVKILIIEDEFEGMTPAEIRTFGEVMHRIIQGRMTAVVSSHSDMVSRILSDKYVIFKKGRITKKCKKEYIKDSAHLEKFLLGNTITTKKKYLDSYNVELSAAKETIYSVENVLLRNGTRMDFRFARGEVVTILALDQKQKSEIFMYLSGRSSQTGMSRFLNKKRFVYDDLTDFVKARIVSVIHMGGIEELLPSLSVGENLLVPSLEKISTYDYMVSAGKMTKMLKQEMDKILVEPGVTLEEMGVNDLIAVMLERWYIYHPNVLVLIEPFVQCDMYGVSLVKSYIRKFAGLGTAVIIIKSRDEYIADISDRILSID